MVAIYEGKEEPSLDEISWKLVNTMHCNYFKIKLADVWSNIAYSLTEPIRSVVVTQDVVVYQGLIVIAVIAVIRGFNT